jgi:hypothetical protein
MIVATAVLCGLMFVSGCQKVSGKYKGDGLNPLTIDFKSSDKADVTALGQTTEITYKVDGKQITLQSPPGQPQSMVLTIGSDGKLTGEGGLTFTKQ